MARASGVGRRPARIHREAMAARWRGDAGNIGDGILLGFIGRSSSARERTTAKRRPSKRIDSEETRRAPAYLVESSRGIRGIHRLYIISADHDPSPPIPTVSSFHFKKTTAPCQCGSRIRGVHMVPLSALNFFLKKRGQYFYHRGIVS